MSISGLILFISTIVVLLILTLTLKRVRRKNHESAMKFDVAPDSKRPSRAGDKPTTPVLLNEYTHLAMTVIISLVIVGFGLYLIIKTDITKETRNWAFGAIGTVIGYWLKKS